MKPMKTKLLSFCIMLLLINCGQDNKIDEEAIKFQNKLNEEFSNKDESPLTEEDLASFTKLDFFPIDSDYRVTAKLIFHKDSKPFKMATTTDRLPVYSLYATASFTLKGKAYQLEIYQNEKLTLTTEYEDYLFLPFTDNTNGETSYGGGRYIDLHIPESDEIIIDFNQAYNPYCAYNKKYSCPIPTKTNHLDLDVRAGVMAYKH
jgi:uncharacterized protein (DUF1684 family)